MLQNAYFLAKIGADTAENEQHFAEILPKTGNYLHRRARRALLAGRPAPVAPSTSSAEGGLIPGASGFSRGVRK